MIRLTWVTKRQGIGQTRRTHPMLSGMCFLAILSACFAPADAQSARPQWIWTAGDRQTDRSVYLRKLFSVHQPVHSAQLTAAVDFNSAAFFCNGQPITVVEDYGPRVQIDVTHAIQATENVIAVASQGSDGPSAVAIRMDLLLEDGTRQSIVSDSSWLGSSTSPAGWRESDFKASDWQSALEFGPVGTIRFGHPNAEVQVEAVDDYTQWKQALTTDSSTDPATFQIPDNFEIELLRSAGDDEGSWVSLAFDPVGRLIIAREEQGLLRLTLPDGRSQSASMEVVENTLRECRGLMFDSGYLYANANNSKGLFRLRDSTGDDYFDDVTLLYHSPGNVGHGRNDLTLGPRGRIYSIHGDAVDLPSEFFDRTSPFREARRGNQSKEGHVIRLHHLGQKRQLMSAGLRNPFGIDFNPDGEMFTYDADAEFDMGAPWYRPTRVHHILPGGDYGWRGVTKQWPPYYPDHPDAAPPGLDIGKGSPTAVQFGTSSNFPPAYRQALFILDWAYGRIMAVRMTPRGASYAMRAEPFARGRPMNVTDLTFGPDGAMYFVTGGRATQSGLYRIKYVGPTVRDQPPTTQQNARSQHAQSRRMIRRQLESLHGKQHQDAITDAWPYLNNADPSLRHAARIAIEHQPLPWWEERALTESDRMASLTSLMALAAAGQSWLQQPILTKLCSMPWQEFSRGQKLIALRICELCLQRAGMPDETIADAVGKQLNKIYPDETWQVNRELSRLLARFNSPDFVRKSMELLQATSDQTEQLHYLFVLRNVSEGWTPELRKSYFDFFELTQYFVAGQGMGGFIAQIKEDALATLNDTQRARAEGILAGHASMQRTESYAANERPFVRDWGTTDLLEPPAHWQYDEQRGRQLFRVAMCDRCHRLGSQGRAFGPDLTSVSNRFSRHDLLQSIVEPSQVVADKYKKDVIETTDGRVIVGAVLVAGDYRSPTLKIVTDPLAPENVQEVAKSKILTHQKSAVSQMPEGLLDSLTKNEIFDLLAYIEQGGRSSASPTK